MKIPTFTWDAEANGWISEPLTVSRRSLAHLELISKAPVVTLKQEEDGGYGNYGQTPDESDRYEITITVKEETVIRLASPVKVLKSYIIELD